MKTKMSRVFWLVTLVVVSSASRTDDNELKDYCSLHRYENLPGGLRFTKEVVSNEYASVKLFKAIHCCLKGYRSIEWYKDSRPYPWPGGESSFILYPESANQTIYTQEVKSSDAGRYSCRARNDTTTLEGDVTLSILGGSSNDYNGRPLTTYRPSSQLVPLGGTARLFCEAYIGRAPMPDATISVIWRKANSNATLSTNGRISQSRASRDKDQIVGAYLVIEDVSLEDYGEYLCQISNGIDDDEVKISVHLYRQEPQFMLGSQNGSWHKSLLLSLLVLVLLLSAAALFVRCWLPLALFCRDKFSRLEEDDSKEFDALVCYHERDANLAVGIIIPTLESRHRYKCASLELSNLSEHWSLEISPHAGLSRRVIVILSPESLSNVWSESNVSHVLKQLSSLSVRTIVVTLKDIPNSPILAKCSRVSSSERRDARSTLELVAGLEILHWRDAHERNFWQRLRLALPPMRPNKNMTKSTSSESSVVVDGVGNQRTMIVQANGGVGQQKARSRESLEVLV